MTGGALLLILVGCEGQDPFISNVEAVVSEYMPTVVMVSWELAEEAEAWVEYAPAPNCDWTTRTRTGTSGTVALMGIPSVTDVCYRVVAELGDSRYISEEGEIRTGNIPSTAPAVTVEVLDEERIQPGYLLGAYVVVPSAIFVLDRWGNYVWYQELPFHYTAAQLQLHRNGQGFLYNQFPDKSTQLESDRVSIRHVGFDGREVSALLTEGGHHAFQQIDDGGYVYIGIDKRDVEGLGLTVGDRIVEVDAEGVTTEIWSAWDHPDEIPFDYNEDLEVGFYVDSADWTHSNYVYADKNRGSYTISMRNLDTVLEVDAVTGEHLRSVGTYGTHAFTDGTIPVKAPHSARWTEDDTLLMFSSPTSTEYEGHRSYGLELSIDDVTEEAFREETYGMAEENHAQILGETYHLENGNTFVSFGSSGEMIEITPEGEVVWRLTLEAGNFPGHSEMITSFAPEFE